MYSHAVLLATEFGFREEVVCVLDVVEFLFNGRSEEDKFLSIGESTSHDNSLFWFVKLSVWRPRLYGQVQRGKKSFRS